MSKQTYVSRGGAVADIDITAEGWVDNQDARYVTLELTGPAGERSEIEIRFPQPSIIDHNTRQELGFEFNQESARKLAIVAGLMAIDTDPEILNARSVIVFNADDVYALPRRPRLTDKEIRRYLSRLLYAAYSDATLDVQVRLDDLDRLITGASEVDFIRNAQVLEADGLARVHLTMGPTLHAIRPTAGLVRAMERWGGPVEDRPSVDEYEAQLRAYDSLDPDRDALCRERARFVVARSTVELESIFRATAPIIEAIARRLLIAHGCTRDLPTLGPIIAEIQNRGLGGVPLLSQLNHVLKFGRDLAEHGHAVSEPVLRIACENAFDLAPQLASLFPRQ